MIQFKQTKEFSKPDAWVVEYKDGDKGQWKLSDYIVYTKSSDAEKAARELTNSGKPHTRSKLVKLI